MPQVGHPIFSIGPTISEWGWGWNSRYSETGCELTSNVQYVNTVPTHCIYVHTYIYVRRGRYIEGGPLSLIISCKNRPARGDWDLARKFRAHLAVRLTSSYDHVWSCKMDHNMGGVGSALARGFGDRIGWKTIPGLAERLSLQPLPFILVWLVYSQKSDNLWYVCYLSRQKKIS